MQIAETAYELREDHLVCVVSEPPTLWKTDLKMLVSDPWTGFKYTLMFIAYSEDRGFVFHLKNGHMLAVQKLGDLKVEVVEC